MKHRKQIRLKRRIGVCVAVALALAPAWPAGAQTQDAAGCGDLSNGDNGPFDFRNERRDLLKLGEAFHFTPKVEGLISGQSRVEVGGDLDFILRMFPNHHRALMAVMRWGEKLRTESPRDMPRPIACYFERALRFRPDDHVARMIYAMFLSRNARQAEALAQLDQVATNAGNNAFTHYNVGLQYFELKQYDKALAQAHAAISLDFPRTELREQLKAVGKWRDPAVVPAPAASATSAPS